MLIAVFAVADPARFGAPFGVAGDLVATAGPSADEASALKVARRYVRALRSGDGPLACTVAGSRLRVAVDSPCEAGAFEPMAGPTPKVADPRVEGDEATVRVARGASPPLRLALQREAGAWRVVGLSGR